MKFPFITKLILASLAASVLPAAHAVTLNYLAGTAELTASDRDHFVDLAIQMPTLNRVEYLFVPRGEKQMEARRIAGESPCQHAPCLWQIQIQSDKGNYLVKMPVQAGEAWDTVR